MAAAAVVLIGVSIRGCLGCGDSGPQAPTEPTLATQGEDLATELSTRRLLGQRVLLPFDGTTLPRTVADRLQSGLAPGVVLFDRNYSSDAQLQKLTAEIQAAASAAPLDLPALIMVDQEGGQVRRVPGPPELSAQAMGEVLTSAGIEEEGRQTGALLAGLGINADLAPVADLGVRGGALTEEGRTFASDPEGVSDLAGAFAEGLHGEGIASTAKHFPGFGSAEVNTDIGPAVIERTADETERDLAPFAAMIDGGVPLVMLSTAVYPEYGTRPAALSPAVTESLLRAEAGFDGVSVTDALDTPALAAYAPPDQVASEALDAPVDLLLYAQSTQASLDAFAAGEEAFESGALDKAELRDAAARVLALRIGLEDVASLETLVGENGD